MSKTLAKWINYGSGLTADGTQLVADTAQLAGTGLESSSDSIRIAAAAAGNGLTGGGGSALAAQADATGGANLATVVDVNSNGIAVKIDDTTIKENGSSQLYVGSDSIGANQLNEDDTFDFTSGNVDVATQTFGDNTTKAASTAFVQAAISGGTGENIKQEMHKITSGEVTAGYFTLSETPTNAQSVRVDVVGGPMQVSKQVVGATGATPDFDVGVDGAATRVSINNNGSATGLSEELTTDDVVIVRYQY